MGIEAAIVSTVVAIGGSTATAVAVASAVMAVAKFVAVTYASGLLAKSQSFDPGIQGRTITKRGTVEPQQKIYGEALVAGTLAFLNVAGRKNYQLWAVHVLSGHQVEDITDVWLDDQVITDAQINGGAAAGGQVTSGDYGPYRGFSVVEVYKHLGTSTQTVNTALSTAFPSTWTSAHRLRGHAYIVTMFGLWDDTETLWEGGEPTNVRALVKGAKVYDPRLDSTRIIDSTTSPITYGSGAHRADDATTWAWSDTPALCVADFLMDSKFSPFPGGIDPDRIDWETVAAAADVCETLVAIPPAASPENTEKRFTCNGALYGTATPEDNLTSLLSSMNGDIVFSGGKYLIHAGAYVSPADSLDEDDIVGPIGISSALDSQGRMNTLTATFLDREKRWQPGETPAVSLAAYVTRDNGDELAQQIQLPFTSGWYMAQRICLKLLYAANQELVLSVPCNLRAARFVPGQRINLTVTERGWAPKIFRVLDWEFFDRGDDQIGVNLKLREDESTAHADPAVSDYSTRSASGSISIATPEVIPSIDTIPRGIQYGEGAWNIAVSKNLNGNGTANDGEIRMLAGTFLLPDGTTRTIGSNTAVYTPYESSEKPPDGVGYLVWGATNPVSRFAASPSYSFGEGTAQTAGLFPAIHDRTQGAWYAVSNAGDEIEFTPATTDYVVARFLKTSSSGGLDALTAVVAFVENPEATRNAWRGAWSDASVAYDLQDMVSYTGRTYTCILAHTSDGGKAPSGTTASNTWWEMLVDTGADGADGLDAITVTTSNEAHTLPADSAGTVSSYAGSGTDIKAFIGTTPIPYGASGANTFSVSASASNITAGSASTVSTYTRRFADHSAATADNATVTYTITVRDASAVETVFTRVQTLTKAKAGATGATGSTGSTGATGPRTATGKVYYQITNGSAPATPSASSFNYSTGAFTGLTTDWATSAPTWAAGNSNKYWYSYYVITEATFGGSQTLTFGTAQQAIGFSGLVTFSDGNTVGDGTNSLSFGASGTTTIKGGNITADNITAALNITTGSLEVSSAGKIYSGKDTFASSNAGWFLGLDSSVPKFKIGNAADTAFLSWDGTSLRVEGALLANVDNVDIRDMTVLNTTVDPGDATAGYRLGTLGQLYSTAGSVVTYNEIGRWLGNGAASYYECRMTTQSGTLTTGTAGSWLAMTTTRTWSKDQTVAGTDTYVGLLEIRRVSDSVVVASGTITLTATVF